MRAEQVFVNGKIRTLDPYKPLAEALAVAGGRIIATGSLAEIEGLCGPGTRRVELGGTHVLPGFHDTHIHLQDGGVECIRSVDLTDTETPESLQDALRRFAKTHSRQWVLGSFWQAGPLGAHNLSAKVLDAAVTDRPCYIVSADAHNACLNSRAMEVIGLTAETPDPPNGHFVRDAQGNPTGMLYENAISWAEARMPQVTRAERREGVLWAQRHANQNGITGVLDARVEEDHVAVYADLAREGAMTLRVAATALVESSDTVESAVTRLKGFRAQSVPPFFRMHSAKFFLDGVFENRTAAMIAPYSDAGGGNANLMFSPEQIAALFTALDAERFQIHVHAIGDLATRAALDGFAMARAANGAWPSWHHIAHIQAIDPADIPRFQPLGVTANIQPLWARAETAVLDVAAPMMGPERTQYMYAFQSLAEAGAMLTLSSDWTVSTLNPFQIIETAVTRQPPEKHGQHPVFLPEQRLTITQSVEGYTRAATRSVWSEGETGELAPGAFADFIVLDRDILTCNPYDIGDTRVLATYLAGQAVHEA
jgi:predicted amidohydrolase YtcJ